MIKIVQESVSTITVEEAKKETFYQIVSSKNEDWTTGTVVLCIEVAGDKTLVNVSELGKNNPAANPEFTQYLSDDGITLRELNISISIDGYAK